MSSIRTPSNENQLAAGWQMEHLGLSAFSVGPGKAAAGASFFERPLDQRSRPPGRTRIVVGVAPLGAREIWVIMLAKEQAYKEAWTVAPRERSRGYLHRDIKALLDRDDRLGCRVITGD